jgi:hypothetical protein
VKNKPTDFSGDIYHYLMFLWQVKFWLATNLLLTLHGSCAVYFIPHRKSIINLTYCLCCVFHTAQKIIWHRCEQTTHISWDDRKSIITLCDLCPKIQYLCFSYNKDILINVRTFRYYQSWDVIYPVLKGSGFDKRFGWDW